jgi:ABC-type nitrate/sulfonate/bicarbonate transport system substrate-binding protein
MRGTLALIVSCWALLWPIAAMAETDVIRIPRGAGGVGFLPLLVMEQKGLVEKQARALGAANLRADWIKLGGPAVVNDLLLSGAADVVVAGLSDPVGSNARDHQSQGHRRHELDPDVSQHPRGAPQLDQRSQAQ